MTNLIKLKEIDQFLADYTPGYDPVMPAFLAGQSQQYSEEVGKINFKRLEALGDLHSRIIGPKDTEMKQINAGETKKTFNKYFLGSQFIVSALQNPEGIESVRAEALDEHNKQSDSLFLTGGGTADNNVINNGLYYSGDANYTKNTSFEVTSGDQLEKLYAKVMDVYQQADDLSGDKMIVFYGPNTIQKHNSLFSTTTTPFLKTLRDAIPEASVAKLPTETTPSGADGFMVVNMSKVKPHYTTLPKIKGQGVNEEKMYAWTNFLMGSSMLEVQAKNGVIRQAITFA